jgi:hypothetical protein
MHATWESSRECMYGFAEEATCMAVMCWKVTGTIILFFNLGVNKKLIFNSGKNIFSRWILNLFLFHY